MHACIPRSHHRPFSAALLALPASLWAGPVVLAQPSNSHSPRPTEGEAHPNILWVYLEDTNAWIVIDRWGDKAVNREYERVRAKKRAE